MSQDQHKHKLPSVIDNEHKKLLITTNVVYFQPNASYVVGFFCCCFWFGFYVCVFLLSIFTLQDAFIIKLN